MLYLISFLFVINMDDWFLIWFGLELNMFSFLLLVYKRNSVLNIESCLKYFFIQSVGSAILLGIYCFGDVGVNEIGCMMMGLKMGVGPFFFWFPSICSGVSWGSCFLLMSFQKFLPLFLMSKMISWAVWFLVMFSLIVGVLGSFNQNNVKMLMAYSSIHQAGWLMMCILVDLYFWIVYFIVYVVVMGVVVVKMNNSGIISLMSVNKTKDKWWLVMMMLNMGGMPPMLGFFLKWMGFMYFMGSSYFLVMFMVMFSVIMFYVYLRVCYSVMLGNDVEVSWVEGGLIYEVGYSNMFDMFMMVGVMFSGVLLILM